MQKEATLRKFGNQTGRDIPSANPPSGIGGVYFAFDVGCLWLYKHYSIKRWQRFRAIQRVRKTMVQPTNIQ